MANKIREDLKDISNTIKHLLLFGNSFGQKSCEWTRWWNDNNTRTNIYRSRDKELIDVVEEVYARGVETAQDLSELLPKINSIKRCPRLKDYVGDIRKMQKNWIAEDEKLLSRCKKIISARKPYNIDFSDVRLMLHWHAKHLKILKDLDSELAVIESSERYKIEEQKQLRDQTEQNTTLAKRRRVKPILCAISAVVIFLAALLTILHYLGWL